jgi:hypothetical protein
MNRRNFLQATVPPSLGIVSGLRKNSHPEGPDSWGIKNDHLTIFLSERTQGGLRAFADAKTGRNFIAKEAPLYRLSAVEKGTKTAEISSQDAESLHLERTSTKSGEALTLTYGRHGALDVTVVCRVLVETGSPLSKWRISIKNDTHYGIGAIQYPIVRAPLMLGDSSEDDYFVTSRGQRIAAPAVKKFYNYMGEVTALPGRIQYPGLAPLQMQAYYDGTAGIYMATYDDAGNVKHFGLKVAEDGLDLLLEHNYDERPGLDFDLPYDTVLGVFHGDWYAAADLYKEWASKQSWCAKKTFERDDLPDWLKEPRPFLLCECRGDYERCRGLYSSPPSDYPNSKIWPAKKTLALSRMFASIFESPVAVWYSGWEKFGSNSGPVDTLPPLEGTDSMQAAMRELSKDGSIVYMAVWGNKWTYKKREVGYDGWDRFEQEGAPLAVLNVRGEVVKNGGAESSSVTLCLASKNTQQLFLDCFGDLMNLGALALQLDQPMLAPICYSDQHGHPTGYGAWMGETTAQFLREVRAAAKKRNAAGTLSFEGAYENWIQDVDFMLDRPYMPGFIPIFTYIYHEYIPFVSGDGPYGVTHPEEQLMQQATNFVYGHIALVMLGLNVYDFEVNPDYPIFTLLKNMCQAARTYARDYLVLGRMLNPTSLDTPKLAVAKWLPVDKDVPDPPTVEVPKVMHSVWASPTNRIGYVLVNWSSEPVEVTLNLVRREGMVAIITNTEKRVSTDRQVKSGQITATVPARNVILMEQA